MDRVVRDHDADLVELNDLDETGLVPFRGIDQKINLLRRLDHGASDLRNLERGIGCARWGTMASGIAHDLNNGLTLILGYGDMLLVDEVKFPEGSPSRASGH
ncbi:MAG: hypothetical protein ABIU29_07470 [Chthoniobacterales bacterium]